jgi:hypothetical protein
LLGVISNDNEREVVGEFFELFKTPWEFYDPNQQYDVVICASNEVPDIKTKLLVILGAEKRGLDMEMKPVPASLGQNSIPIYNDSEIPVEASYWHLPVIPLHTALQKVRG